MPSEKKMVALRIARSLRPAEEAANTAALKILAVGTAALTARTNGTVHPLTGQNAIELIGSATARAYGLLNDLDQAHQALRRLGQEHQVIGWLEGVEGCPDPETAFAPLEQTGRHDVRRVA